MASLCLKVACKAELRKGLLFFLLLAINPCTPGQPPLGRLTPRWFLMACVPTARQASALPIQPPQRIPSLGMRGAVPNPGVLECVHSYPLHGALVNSGQPDRGSRGMACLCRKCQSLLWNLKHEERCGHGRAVVPKLIKIFPNLALSYAWWHQSSGWQMSVYLNYSLGKDA